MADIVSKEKRSQMMSGIKGKNTKPELIVRSILYKRGFRYRLHVKNLPGKPDLVLARYKAAIFIHGCFWHGHDCPLFKLPSSNQNFWKEKIDKNKLRDIRDLDQLKHTGWKIVTIWECAFRGKGKMKIDNFLVIIESWIKNGQGNLEIRGL